MPIIFLQNVANLTPCKPFVMQSPTTSSVGQHSMAQLPCPTWSVVIKCLMFKALVLFPELVFPSFSSSIVLLLSCHTLFSLVRWPCASMNNGVHNATGNTWSTPTNSDVVELDALSFCFAEVLCTAPLPPTKCCVTLV